MNKFKVEKEFVVDGFRCVVVGLEMGHRCGYIEIPKDHKYYGVEYDDINVDVHGGWTYSEYTYNNYPIESDINAWWIGFDCAHWNDAKDIELIKSFGDTELSRFYVKMSERFFEQEEIRTTEYVENELRKAVKELKDMFV